MPNEPTGYQGEPVTPPRDRSIDPAPSSATEATASLHDLKDKLSDDISEAAAAVHSTASAAAEKLEATASEKTGFVARQVTGVATVLEKVGSELDGSEQAEIGRLTKQMGVSVGNFARQMEGKDIGEIATMAEEFGRKQPLAFFGITALAGFAASRFLTASANRASKTKAASAGRSSSSSSSELGGTKQ